MSNREAVYRKSKGVLLPSRQRTARRHLDSKGTRQRQEAGRWGDMLNVFSWLLKMVASGDSDDRKGEDNQNPLPTSSDSDRADFAHEGSSVETKPSDLPPPHESDNQRELGVLRRTFDALRYPVVVIGARHKIHHANAEAHDLFGPDAVGHNLDLFLREPKAIQAIREVMQDGGSQSLDVNLTERTQRQYTLIVTRLPAAPHEHPYAILEFQENTLIKRSESMRSEFVANLTHELRSPLATLIGFIETIQTANLEDEQMDPEAQARFLSIMEGEAHRMSRMIDDLLVLTNVELREHERPRVAVDVGLLMREVVNSLVVRGRRNDVEIILDIPENLPLVNGDSDQLIQVLHNLITNAIKYGAQGKRVDVSAHAADTGLPNKGGCVQIHVRDYGEGIASEHLPRLTERFYRIDKGRSRSMGGTGLGLAIVKHIVNRHRGRFHIQSTLGEGTTFSVSLPLYHD